LPDDKRPNANSIVSTPLQYDLLDIDIFALEGPHRLQVISAIGHACQQIKFFWVINHGVEESLLSDVMRVASEFFEFPMEERKKFISEDMMKPVTYDTSFNYLRGQVICWRYFLKHNCHPLDQMLPLWPSNPFDYRSVMWL
jgi:isopenicillin N synthase-like dioxygenase